MTSRAISRTRKRRPSFHAPVMGTWDEPHRRGFRLRREERWFTAAVGVQEDPHPHSRPIRTSVTHRATCGLAATTCSNYRASIDGTGGESNRDSSEKRETEGEPGLFWQRWRPSEEGFRWGSRQQSSPLRRTVDARGLCLGPWQGLETRAVAGLEIQTKCLLQRRFLL